MCGGCDAYYPWAALFLGGIAGALHLLASMILVKMKIDDPLDAAPIHFVCGKMICVPSPDCDCNFTKWPIFRLKKSFSFELLI